MFVGNDGINEVSRFDEVHFGGFATKYIKTRFFFDVHPPVSTHSNSFSVGNENAKKLRDFFVDMCVVVGQNDDCSCR